MMVGYVHTNLSGSNKQIHKTALQFRSKLGIQFTNSSSIVISQNPIQHKPENAAHVLFVPVQFVTKSYEEPQYVHMNLWLYVPLVKV